MNKILFGVISLLLLGTTFTVVNAENEGKPFQEVWDELVVLEEKLNNIQLIPGPTGPQGPQGETGPVGPQGPAGNDGGSSFNLPDELKPTVVNVRVCKQRFGNGLGFFWGLKNEYGDIPNETNSTNGGGDITSSGISWGTLEINSNLSPDYRTYNYRSNGFQHSLSFPGNDLIGNGSPYKMDGKVLWNGELMEVSHEGVWNENINICPSNAFNQGF